MPLRPATIYDGRGNPWPEQFWHCPTDLYAAALAISNPDLRRLVGVRLSQHDGKAARFAANPFRDTLMCLQVWRRAVPNETVVTRAGRFEFDDSPALDASIEVMEEAVADLEGRRVQSLVREAA